MYAAVDLGSNSFRLSIGQHDGGKIRVLNSMREPIRLAAGLDAAGNLTDEALQRALICLKNFRVALAAYQFDGVRVVATAILRQARNAADFLPQLEQAIGYPIEIISGEEEGRLIYMGVANALGQPNESRLVVDIGGGSTELILGRGLDIERVESFSVGSVKQSLSFFVGGRVDARSFEAAVLSARSHFEDGAPPYHPEYWKRAYGSSGTIRAIGEIIERNKLGEGITLAALNAVRKRFIEFGQVSKIDMPGLRPDRASTVIGGLAILIAVVQELGIEKLEPIDAGLRMGVMWDLHLRSTRRDRRDESVGEFLARFHIESERGVRVSAAATILFLQMKPASDALLRHLCWGAQLHEVGLVVSQTGYHKHSAYMIENADLPGFTTREQKLMGRLVLAQKGNLRKVSEHLTDSDFAKAVVALRLAIMFMHCRIEVDERAVRLRMKNRIDLELKRDYVANHPTLSYWIEKEQEFWDEIGVDFGVRTVAQ
ncbi:exopolyphosphatase / guanosine-5'-triphosphate,3'-diphosphate pyrophosphatase [Duganella sp. CF458]|uniref:Ppx/GppA phosphatase family protein n=1 Tax=Duganella sp. CF458 TaxID=1884368 RepID=UPI0008E66770|nr:Ppx/GppA phosphatase family protein [Duganella sp. CF458]SFF86405.1 exopolyphosphatase / guanosine-5'-triphosphate,3'-diphosphate pyrophosphatase [Duganella sp. CF458]